MLLRKLRRRAAALRYYGRSLFARRRRTVRVLIVFAIFLVIASLFYLRLRPLIANIAIAAASDSVTKAVNSAVGEKIADGSIDYMDMIRFEKDTEGHISALTANMPKITELQTQIVTRVIELLKEKRVSEFSIPVGNLIGGSLLSGRGFGIPVRIVSAGATTASFSNKFSSAGINQTRHQIVLAVNVDINILIPASIVKTTVCCEISVAETVIVGDVPESYTFFEDNGELNSKLDKYDIVS